MAFRTEHLSLDEITGRAWSLHRPNGDCRTPLLLLQPGGNVVGYEHPNESSWAPHPSGFAFLSREGKVTSSTAEIRRNHAGVLQIRMVHPGSGDRTAHVLLEVRREVKAEAATEPAQAPEVQPGGQDPAARPAGMVRILAPVTTHIEACAPEAASVFLDPEITRVFFIGNNKDISLDLLESLNLGAADILVQYNRAMFFDALAKYSCHKVHFFSPNTKSCWGFTEDARPELEYDGQEYSSLTFAVAHWVPNSVRPYFESLSGRARHMAIVPDRHIALYCYPAGRAPSAGFISVAFFRSLNWIRRQQNRKALQLTMIGFTGVYAPGKAWPGHDFPFEQAAYGTWLDLRRLNIDGSLFNAVPAVDSFGNTPAYVAVPSG